MKLDLKKSKIKQKNYDVSLTLELFCYNIYQQSKGGVVKSLRYVQNNNNKMRFNPV